MDLGIEKRVALVAASGRGLGRATAERLGMEGAHVAICDVDEDVLEEAQAAVSQVATAGKVFAYHVDLTDREQIETLVEQVREDLGPISILITNSGGASAR